MSSLTVLRKLSSICDHIVAVNDAQAASSLATTLDTKCQVVKMLLRFTEMSLLTWADAYCAISIQLKA